MVRFHLAKRLSILNLTLAILLVSWACATAAVTRVDIPLPDGGVLPAFLFTNGNTSVEGRPGVVVAANAGGTKLIQYHTYCSKLAERDFVVLLVDASNFPESFTPGPDSWRRMPYHAWAWVNHILVATRLTFGHDWYVGNIDAAVEYLSSLPSVDPRRVALSGFSQSANASLCYASGKNGKLRCVVWNNGGSPWIMPYDPSRLPSVLILHGEKDGVYSVKYARKLSAELQLNGRDVECSIYPGQRHMFMVYYDLTKPSEAENPALISSFKTLCAFLDRTLGEDRRAPRDEKRSANR